ncbi:MAG: STAS domain-containing protein [Ruminococcus sp.]|nr:STAS domain-containing protein [Ruminococcus sp.]
MRTSLDNNTLTLFLEGRIDTNNAPRVDAEITEAIDGVSPENIVIDAANLDYISSAGLRVLMKLRKSAGRALPVINVSRDGYDIFDTTGFTELFDVKKALRIISVKGCVSSGL